MPSSDYTTASGGALKLKNGGGKVDKKRKHKSKKTSEPIADSSVPTSRDNAAQSTKHDRHTLTPTADDTAEETAEENALIARAKRETAPHPKHSEDLEEEEETEAPHAHKTEAEKRHEAMRRRRLDEILRRKGSKTHKERVEELNRYLAGLSEHHDMPRIGPG